MSLAIEAGLSVLALALAFTVPKLGARWFEAVEHSFSKLAHRRGLSVVSVGLTALALRTALLPILPIPVPGSNDEYGYLLLSDTFAHGRLTNPTHPMWMHFENLFILWHPTYTAKYWPAQGLFMAAGQALMGHPFWGVWLSVGLMCAAICWMLQAWVGEGWALLGGFLAVIRFGTFNYWANSYWGGAVTALGGALVLGALPRMKQEHRVRNALLMGLGFALLANSRPYEGLLFGIPVAAAILVWLWKLKRPELGRAVKQAMVPLLAVLALTVVCMGYYFWRTTGNPFTPPYVVYKNAYNPVPYFPWQRLRPIPHYRHDMIRRDFLETQLPTYESSRTVAGQAGLILVKGVLFWSFYIGPALTLPLLLVALALPMGFSWRNIRGETRFLMGVAGSVIVGNGLLVWYAPHYSAPITCVVLALILIAMRFLMSWHWHGKPTGMFVSRMVPSICLLLLVLGIAAGALHIPVSHRGPGSNVPTWCWQSPPNLIRADALSRLRNRPGRQLVIVHYSPDHNPELDECVFNGADINSSKVVWADDMGPAKNQELIRYFKNRRVWLLDVDGQPPRLRPYPGAAVASDHGVAAK